MKGIVKLVVQNVAHKGWHFDKLKENRYTNKIQTMFFQYHVTSYLSVFMTTSKNVG